MIEQNLSRQRSLVDQVLSILIERIINGIYPPKSKLPTEIELSEEFNVSRSTIRTAISRLEDRKLIHRQQGVGTYVSEHLNISNPLNEFIEFPKLIRNNGYEPGYRELSSEIMVPDEKILEDLNLEPNSKVLKIRKIFTANGDPIIFVVNHIPLWVFKDSLSNKEALQEGITKNFSEFFEITCGQTISHYISTIKADILSNTDVPPELSKNGKYVSVLIINEIGFNDKDSPIVSSCEYHPGDRMTFRMIRRSGNI